MVPLPSTIDVSPLKERSAPFWEDFRLFWEDRHTFRFDAAPLEGDPDLDWIISESGVPWLELDVDIPRHEEMVDEALRCRELFVGHRESDGWGWLGSTLHGIDSKSTRSPGNYGYGSDSEAPYVWTELADRCPVTTAFLKEFLAFKKLNRVRFMLLEPMGCILPHIDTWNRSLTSLNISLSNPEGAHFKLLGRGEIPFTDGKAFLVDVSSTHSCVNLSNTPRLHIIAHGEGPLPEFNRLVQRSFSKTWGRQTVAVDN